MGIEGGEGRLRDDDGRARQAVHQHDPLPGRRHGRRTRTPGIPGCRSAPRRWPTCCGRASCATTRATRAGAIAIASCCRRATASALLYALLHLTGYRACRSISSSASASGGACTPGPSRVHLTPRRRGVAPGRSGRASATPSAWRSARRTSRRATTAPGHEVFNHRTYVLASDGDLMEGVAGRGRVARRSPAARQLIVLYDNNHVTLSGTTSLAFTEDVAARYRAYGWHVAARRRRQRPRARSTRAMRGATTRRDRPSLISVKTVIGYGAPDKQGTFAGARQSARRRGDVRKTKRNLGWPDEPPFYIPDRGARALRDAALERGSDVEERLEARFAAYAQRSSPSWPTRSRGASRASCPIGWAGELPVFAPTPRAWRRARPPRPCCRSWRARCPSWSAARAISIRRRTRWLKKTATSSRRRGRASGAQGTVGGGWSYAGRNIHFGVREHAMGAAVNGLAYHGGFIPFGATFLVFSDYMRPAIRLAALAAPALDLRVHARQHRPRRGRADATSRSSSSRRCARFPSCW